MAILSVSTSAELVAALKSAAGGDRIVLADGDYGALVLDTRYLKTLGVYNSEVTVAAAHPGGARFDSLDIRAAAHLAFEGIAVTRLKAAYGSTGIALRHSTATELSFRDVDGLELTGNTVGGGLYAVTLSSVANFTLRDNILRDAGADLLQIGRNSYNGLVENNRFLDVIASRPQHPDLIQIFGAEGETPHDIVIRGNHLYDDPATGALMAQGIFLNNPSGTGFSNITIEQNLLSVRQINSIYINGGVENVRVLDNTLISGPEGYKGGALRLADYSAFGNAGVTAENNVFAAIIDETEESRLAGNLIYGRGAEGRAALFAGAGAQWQDFLLPDGSLPGAGAVARLEALLAGQAASGGAEAGAGGGAETDEGTGGETETGGGAGAETGTGNAPGPGGETETGTGAGMGGGNAPGPGPGTDPGTDPGADPGPGTPPPPESAPEAPAPAAPTPVTPAPVVPAPVMPAPEAPGAEPPAPTPSAPDPLIPGPSIPDPSAPGPSAPPVPPAPVPPAPVPPEADTPSGTPAPGTPTPPTPIPPAPVSPAPVPPAPDAHDDPGGDGGPPPPAPVPPAPPPAPADPPAPRLPEESGGDGDGAALAPHLVYAMGRDLMLSGNLVNPAAYPRLERIQHIASSADLEIDAGTVALTFEADTLGWRRGLLSRDSLGTSDGLSVWFENGLLQVKFEDAGGADLVRVAGLKARQSYDLQISFGEGTGRVWIDGRLAGEVATGMDWTRNHEELTLGADNSQSAAGTSNALRYAFDGRLAGIAIYDEAMSPDQLQGWLDGLPLI